MALCVNVKKHRVAQRNVFFIKKKQKRAAKRKGRAKQNKNFYKILYKYKLT